MNDVPSKLLYAQADIPFLVSKGGAELLDVDVIYTQYIHTYV